MILDRYFSRQIWASFIGFGLILGGMAWMVQILLLLKYLVKYGVEIGGFVVMSTYTFPFLFSIIIPFVIFISVMFVYTKSIGNNEIAVCYASGKSPISIARPAIVIGIIVMISHLVMNAFIVPKSQDLLLRTQWDLRYGLGHLKLNESMFNQLAEDVVIYIEKVNQKDIYGITMRDGREDAERYITAENGKLVSTKNSLSIVMGTGGLQMNGKSGVLIGTFDSAEMDMKISDASETKSFRARRTSSKELLNLFRDIKNLGDKYSKRVLGEMATRFLAPVMDLILILIAVTILLKTNILRRRASFSATAAAAAMSIAELSFLSISASLATVGSLLYLAIGQVVIIIGLLWYLRK